MSTIRNIFKFGSVTLNAELRDSNGRQWHVQGLTQNRAYIKLNGHTTSLQPAPSTEELDWFRAFKYDTTRAPRSKKSTTKNEPKNTAVLGGDYGILGDVITFLTASNKKTLSDARSMEYYKAFTMLRKMDTETRSAIMLIVNNNFELDSLKAAITEKMNIECAQLHGCDLETYRARADKELEVLSAINKKHAEEQAAVDMFNGLSDEQKAAVLAQIQK